MSNNQILIDSDAFFGWINPNDAHHIRATELYTQLTHDRLPLVTTSYVVSETATVISNRLGHAIAISFLDTVQKIPVIHITEDLQKKALGLFREQTKRGMSVVDCANVVVCRHYPIAKIFSFDGFYRSCRLALLGDKELSNPHPNGNKFFP